MVAQPWRATVLTLFPNAFPGPLGVSILKKAQENAIWTLETVDIRAFASDKHASVDDTPAGGGPGMVMRADVIAKAIDHVHSPNDPRPVLYMSPRGAPLCQSRVRKLAAGTGAVFLCGRFEGLDERVLAARQIEEVSLGDFVLAGGEVAAQTMIEAAVRLLPGVVGDKASLEAESFEGHLLEYPHYTRPQSWEGAEIPEILTSGHHGKVADWRKAQAEELTRVRRPDMWLKYRLAQRRRTETGK